MALSNINVHVCAFTISEFFYKSLFLHSREKLICFCLSSYC